MDQTRSSSVPLLTLGEDFSELLRSSYSLPSMQPSTLQFVSSILSSKEEEHIHEESSSHHLIDEGDNESMLSSGSENEIGVAIHGRKAPQSLRSFTMSALSSDVLYEDIWTDSPAFHDYLKQLEGFLQRYVTWLEKLEQCRQLEIAYNKSMTLLFEQSKLILSEPFYTSAECQQLQWPTTITSVDDQDELIKTILPCLRDHSANIKEVLARFESIIADLRMKHSQSLSTFCASQKQKPTQSNHRLLDDISTSLYTAKRDLCKVLLEYIQTLNELIKSTRQLVHDKICPVLKNHQLAKQTNLNLLNQLVLILDDFNRDGTEHSSILDISFSRFSFEDCDELNNDRLSYYIQDKLTSYYDQLKKSTVANEQTPKSRPSSPGSLIPFLNRPRIAKYSSLDSVVSSTSQTFASQCLQITTKGYLFAKQKYPGNASIYANGGNKSSMHINSNKWERHYFFISKDDGFLNQHVDHTSVVQVANLYKVDIQASETDKRDFVIQVISEDNLCLISLQAEISADFSQWMYALKSWNPNQSIASIKSTKKSSPKKVKSKSLKINTYSTPTSQHQHQQQQEQQKQQQHQSQNQEESITLCQSPRRRSDFFSNTTAQSKSSSDYSHQRTKGGLVGYPVPVTECPIHCCSTTDFTDHSKVQLTGLFRIHKLCIDKSNCVSYHTGALCVLHVSLFENGLLHMQTEKDDNTFFHLPIQLTSLSTQDVYPFSDSIDHMKYCIVIRSKPFETYHLLAGSKVQRDTWIHRLKACCKSGGSSRFLLSDYEKPLPNNPKTTYSLSVRIVEARKLVTSQKDLIYNEIYCDIVVDNEIRGLTGSSRKNSTVSWKEEFHFPDIAEIADGVTINMYTRNSKNFRESLYGILYLPTASINAEYAMQEEWYEIRKEIRQRTFPSLTSLSTSSSSYGQLRVGILFEKFQVYSLDYYQPLTNILAGFKHDIIYEIAQKAADIQTLAKNLLRIYEGMGMTLTWIKSLIDYEVSCLNTDDVNILFRGNSFFTTVLDNYMKMSGKEFLEEALQHSIQEICQLNLHIEVEPSRIKNFSPKKALANCTKLFVYVRTVWEDIDRVKFKCPIELRRIFGHLQAAIVRKFNLSTSALDRQHQLARYTCVSGFVFLRWICPAIISPKLFGLVQDHPDAKTCRTLTLIAKCLMTLASHSSIEQSTREPWVVFLNEFVQNNAHQFVNFINFISMGDDALDNTNIRTKQEPAPHFIDLALELSRFTSWCSHECDAVNLITRICRSIHHQDVVKETMAVDYRKKSRPKPWKYGDEYFTKQDAVHSHSNNVRSPSVAE